MAIVLDGWGVVARRSTVEAKLPGGFAGWFDVAPNRMTCADRDLCFVAFMVPEDAHSFVFKLDSLGLAAERNGAFRDVALVGKDGVWQHMCPWLRIGTYGGVNAVWMHGVDADPLVVPVAWRPNAIINFSDEESERRLEFLRRDGNVEVFLDKETGKEMYRARTGPSDTMDAETEKRFQSAVAAVEPLLTFDGHPRRLGWLERRRLAKGIRQLEAIAADDRWRVWWYIGMARRAGGDAEGAFTAFERAYTANPAEPNVGRELGGQCMALGRGKEAVEVCERMCSLSSDDAGLRANLALACMVADDMKRAKVEVTRALDMDPADKISRVLASMIDDVIAGKRARLTKYP
jgi:hypothetical protein